MTSLIFVALVMMAAPPPAEEAAAPPSRAQFARLLAKVRPGMGAAEARKIVGPPDDIRTAHDPGGIVTTGTDEMWGYGTRAHLGFATLGTIYIKADRTVQYVEGGKG